jgi:hypothetical protein
VEMRGAYRACMRNLERKRQLERPRRRRERVSKQILKNGLGPCELDLFSPR